MTDNELYVIRPRGRAGDETAHQLRGGPVFAAFNANLSKYRTKVYMSAPGPVVDGVQQTTTFLPKEDAPPALALIDLTSVVDRLDIWNQIRQRTTTIVDVHFPLGSLTNIQALQPGRNEKTRDLAADADTRDYWSDAERQARAAQILAQADIVVSPHRSWVQLLMAWSTVSRDWFDGQGAFAVPINVRLLRDVNSPESGGRFYADLVRLAQALLTAEMRQRSLWRRATWQAVRLLSTPIVAAAARTMTRDLADVDFSYAKVPS